MVLDSRMAIGFVVVAAVVGVTVWTAGRGDETTSPSKAIEQPPPAPRLRERTRIRGSRGRT